MPQFHIPIGAAVSETRSVEPTPSALVRKFTLIYYLEDASFALTETGIDPSLSRKFTNRTQVLFHSIKNLNMIMFKVEDHLNLMFKVSK